MISYRYRIHNHNITPVSIDTHHCSSSTEHWKAQENAQDPEFPGLKGYKG